MPQKCYLNPVRSKGGKRALVFVHGFTGDQDDTWGSFPMLMGSELTGGDWDIYTLGYDSSFLPDLGGIWSADPDLPIIAKQYLTELGMMPLSAYSELVLVAHSMGGLVAQYALVKSAPLRARVKQLVLFGTPSGGLRKAVWLAFWKRQLKNMAEGSAFIEELRSGWNGLGTPLPFKLVVVAGSKDQFVPPESSLLPFEEQCHRVVPGDHLEIVKPDRKDAESVRLLLSCLTELQPTREASVPPPPAAESLLRRAAIMPAQDIDAVVGVAASYQSESEAVDAALALDAAGKRQESIALLERHLHLGTDVRGTLGGRYKRLYLARGSESDALRAHDLYEIALQRSLADRDSSQIFYHAINVAFLDLAAGNLPSAQQRATLAQQHAQRAPGSLWSVATQAEACLYLGKHNTAIELYRSLPQLAQQLGAKPWMLVSAGQQAFHAARMLEQRGLAEELDRIFTPCGGKIFVSYAREDRAWLEWFKLQLTPYLQNVHQELELWDDSRIAAGAQWEAEIEQALQHCNVAVLLVSEHFLGSEFIRQRELPALVRRAGQKELRLLWCCVSPCAYEATPLQRFQAVVNPAEPLVALPPARQGAVLLEVARAVRDAALQPRADWTMTPA